MKPHVRSPARGSRLQSGCVWELVGALLVGVLPVGAGCGTQAAPPEQSPVPVRVAVLRDVAVARELRYSASIAPAEQVLLAFKVTGYVDFLLQVPDAAGGFQSVQQGDRVTGNAVLARVRDDDYQANVQQADARVVEAQAALAKAVNDLRRATRLFGVDSITRPELEAAQLAVETSEARHQVAHAGAELARTALADTTLRAPFSGIVLERRVERGALVAPGTVAFVLGDVRSVKAVFGVPDSVLHTLRIGAPLTVRTDAVKGRQSTGRITAISPAANPQTRVFSVEVTLRNHDGALKPGMIATVDIAGGAAAPAKAATSVPLASIVKDNADPTGYAVFVVEHGGGQDRARIRPVQLGDVMGNAIQVTAGVQIGERVVISGATLVKPDDIVRVIP